MVCVYVIYIENLTKSYGVVIALRNVNLLIEAGTIHGIFGPNGAGKTTLLKVLSGIARPDYGRIFINNLDVTETPLLVKSIIGVQLEQPAVYNSLSLYNYYSFFAKLGGLRPNEARFMISYVLDFIEMENSAYSLIHGLSLGQRQRVEIGRAILHNPAILMLDEPFIALDMSFRKKLRYFLKEWKEDGRVVIITSHNLEEAKLFIDDFTLIDRGRIVDKLDALERKYYPFSFITSNNEYAAQILSQEQSLCSFTTDGDSIKVNLESLEILPIIIKKFVDEKILIHSMKGLSDLEFSYQELVER